jgi:hypothetical protein
MSGMNLGFGFVGIKPIGGIAGNHPGMKNKTPEQIAAEQAKTKAEQQAKVDKLIDNVAQQNVKRWSIPYNKKDQ